MVKVSENLGATVVLLVALVVASLLILSFLKVFQETNIYIRRVAKIVLHFTKQDPSCLVGIAYYKIMNLVLS